jgi:hypothetical protein
VSATFSGSYHSLVIRIFGRFTVSSGGFAAYGGFCITERKEKEMEM